MTTYSTLELTLTDRVATLWLNRPDVRNAFNGEMIAELIDCLGQVAQDENIIALLLRGKGKVFCGGADIAWMGSFSERTYEEDYQGNQQLAQCFHAVYTLPQPTIAVVQGAAFGGASGLLAACDMAYAVENTTFAFSEVKIGIIPATIAPYVLRRVGEAAARELMLTGTPFRRSRSRPGGLGEPVFPHQRRHRSARAQHRGRTKNRRPRGRAPLQAAHLHRGAGEQRGRNHGLHRPHDCRRPRFGRRAGGHARLFRETKTGMGERCWGLGIGGWVLGYFQNPTPNTLDTPKVPNIQSPSRSESP